jgi:TrmH family RNA methyltransferase
MSDRVLITSVQHPRVKEARALHLAKRRAETGLFLAEGVKLIAEALAAGVDFTAVFVSPRLAATAAGRDLESRLSRSRAPLVAVADRVIAAIAPADTSQGVVAIARRPERMLAEVAVPARAPIVVAALGIQEPGNLGALVRIAEAFGAAALVALGSADPWGPKAVRASAASVFRLPVVVAGADRGLRDLHELRERGYRLVAAVSKGGVAPAPAMFVPPFVLILGAEGHGLDADVAAAADTRVTIRLARTVDSLNVAAAAAVLLHAARGG